MFSLPGYKINEKIYESGSSLVYRGQREKDDIAVVLKVLKKDYPSREELVRYRQEYEITHNLELQGVIRVFAQEKYGNSLVIVLEDFGGFSLKELRKKRIFSIIEILELAIRITDILGKIHAKDVIHKDINPANIVFNPNSDQLKFIDFGISTKLSREITQIRNPENLEGTLSYMSPEQTGRMNRALDYRSDYYALGATLYELLAGQPPFEAKDSMELVHAHLAKTPVSPHELNSLVSENLSRVILKLLAKRAEERYQSVPGITADLVFCLREALNDEKSSDFTPGGKDVRDHFSLPQTLYGREKELDFLLSASERAAIGPAEAFFIAGYSGVGKSALVGELYKPIAVRRGYFISGKFDQYHSNMPYSAVQTAFQDLLGQLMTETRLQIAVWKGKILQSLGPNGRLMTEFLPDLELIIGECAPLPELDATAARNRFNFVLHNFVEIFCQAGHPLVIFLDDLQWADPASFQFMELLLKGSRHLFLIGAYRDNEVTSRHPLLSSMKEIRKTGTFLKNIELKPLEERDVRRYIAELTNTDEQTTQDLAILVKQMTQGNPFFMGELLKSLYRENILQFNPGSGSWSCDLARLKERNIPQDVVEFMAHRIGELNSGTRSVLARAACIGNVFDLTTLSLIYEKPVSVTAAHLWPALSQDLILPLNLEYKIATLLDTEQDRKEQIKYKFAHDRIEEAAYSLIPEEQRPAAHLKLGRMMLTATNKEERVRKLFEIVDHLNVGADLMQESSELDELAGLNLNAGRKAYGSNAYGLALRYFRKGLELLGENAWDKQYERCLEAGTLGAEAAFLGQNYKEMEELAEEVLGEARTILDTVRIYEIRIMAFQNANDFKSAIQFAREALKKWGVKLPQKPNMAHVLLDLALVKKSLYRKSFESLLNAPQMTNPKARAASRILAAIFSGVYISEPTLLPLVVTGMIRLTLKFGNSDESPIAYSTYGLILCGVLGDIENGSRMGRLAMDLVDKFKLEKVRTRVSFVFYTTISHWQKPVHDSRVLLEKNANSGLETGDLEYYGYSLMYHSLLSLLIGRELMVLKKEAFKNSTKLLEFEIKTSLQYQNMTCQVIETLQNNAPETKKSNYSEVLTGTFYNETEMLPQHENAQDKAALFFLSFWKLMFSCLFQEHSNGLLHAMKAALYLEAIPGQIAVALYHYYDSLVHLAVYRESTKSEQKRIRKRVKANQKKIRNWAKHAPMNNTHRYALVAAEEARVQGRPEEARKQYERATELARKNDYLNDEALAWELAGVFYLEENAKEFSKFCLKNAHYSYSLWGARAKVLWLEQRYPWLGSGAAHSPEGFTAKKTRHPRPPSRRSTDEHGRLDLNSIMKASTAIAEEKNSATMMQKLMQVVLENTGAGEGYLIIAKNDDYFGEAHALAENDTVTLLSSPALESMEELPQSLISYVIRTKKPLVLDKAGESDLFRDDPAIRHSHSVLCAPILYQDQLFGLLYLENNLADGAFTPERLEVLRLLSAQIAVSLKNALDYEELLRANRVKGLFLGKMSHELRTPLNHILGTANKLLRQERLEIGHKEAVQEIIDSGGRLRHFIDNLMDFSTSSEKQSQMEEFNLNQVLETRIYIFRKRAEEKGLNFAWQKNASLPEQVRGDRIRLEQILSNLLDNAVKYTQSGEIIFTTRFESGKLFCKIEDSGPGISPDQQERIFLAFQDEKDGFQSAEGTGMTGLGLNVSKMLAEEMGGTLKLENRPEGGAIAGLVLPFTADAPTTQVEETSQKIQEVTLTAPPSEILIKLHELAKNGDIVEVLNDIERLKKSQPEYDEFFGEVRRLAQGFKERQLREFIQKFME